MTLYFAYGSNLNIVQMRHRCPDAKSVGAMKLEDWRLVFRGVADIIPSPGNAVPGAVWKLTPECEDALDIYEGISGGLYRKEYLPIAPFKFAGETHDELLIYVMNSTGIMPPSQYYLSVIREGYRDFSLPKKPLDAAVEASHDDKAPSHIERRRHARKGRPELAPRPSEVSKQVRKQPSAGKLSAQRKAAQAADKASRDLKAKPQREPQLDLGLFRRAMIVYGD